MPEGNEYLYLEKIKTIEEVDKNLEEIAKEGIRDHPSINNLKEFNKRAYRHAIRLGKIAIRKTRWSKFIRYKNNIINYIKGG